MDARFLRTFIAVVENRGFAHAADALGCSQPTVSAQVSALEEDLGATLFHRDRRPVQLTASGEVFLRHARTILNEMEAARGSVSDVLGARRGTVRLGSYPSASAGYIPSLLQQFRQRFPLVKIHLVELNGPFLEQSAINGEIELFIRHATPPLSTSTFDSTPLWREDFKVVIPPEHELAKESGPMPPEVLLRQELIMTGRHVAEGLLTHPFWHSLGEPPNVIYEVSQPQSLIELVRARLGVGVLTQLALDVSSVGDLVTRPIDHPEAVRRVSVYWVRDRPLSSASRALLEFINDEADVPSCTISTRRNRRAVQPNKLEHS